jgi:uncharacterized small protein (DUF1192 family)
MRRTRNDGTKVWHNPEVDTPARRRSQASGRGPEVQQDKREVKQHRAALEALFSPRKHADAKAPADGKGEGASSTVKVGGRGTGQPAGGRIVLAPPPQSDPKTAERQKLLGKLLVAEGRPQISKAANDFLRAGFTFPVEQDVQLQLLEHSNEAHVLTAIDALRDLLVGELPKRRAMLESRLRRIEQFAEDPATREAAECLRRSVSGRPARPTTTDRIS